ncbi:LysR family transcriptional regulator [Ralstonia sp. A12]|uniref:LysR family transcriptional regulator n=1 Tax=Ralstonia sp. A12 TaxID=1217052 RepID=UPI0005755445|nr:LysR family transcriptional regulator [Ralstonia sp. A12]KHK57797.1 LysR family transcriptional regulator [Ralstonia sp. A12]
MQDRLELLRIFTAAASATTFREAAARLGVSPQAVTRAVRELEDTLGETLFHRNTRSVQITRYGQDFAAQAQTALQTVDGLFDASSAKAAEAGGIVRVTAPSHVGRTYVMPVLTALMQQHPGLVADLRLSDTPSAVVDEQIDVGVRVGFIGDNRFVARSIGSVPLWVVAAPALLDRVGEPKTPDALLALPVTTLINRTDGRAWPWAFRGDTQLQPHRTAFVTDDPETEVQAACAGLGFTQTSEYLLRPHVERGDLVRVLRRFEPLSWTLHVYRPQRGPVPTRVRVVFDALTTHLKTLCRS